MNKYDNILNLKDWSIEEAEFAIKYYEVQLKDLRNDDNELSWLRNAIIMCESHIDKLNGTQSEWEKLFI